jgi:hypothetical protein
MPRLLPYLQLCRLPAVFSAMADIFAGYLLTHRSPPTLGPGVTFAALLVASSALYLAGMVLNDVFDREVDARERPGRPIPSGQVPLATALRLGIALLLIGNASAARAGWSSLIIAAALTACILAYDGGLKKTLAGPFAMGGCRFLNIMLGASAAPEVWALPQLHVAAAMGAYIVGVTMFARQEAELSRRTMLTAATGVVNLGFALLAAYMLNFAGGMPGTSTVILLAVIAITVNRHLVAGIFEPTPVRVQQGVKTMLLSLIMLDAAIVLHATGSAPYACAVIVLLLPAMLLGKWMTIT